MNLTGGVVEVIWGIIVGVFAVDLAPRSGLPTFVIFGIAVIVVILGILLKSFISDRVHGNKNNESIGD